MSALSLLLDDLVALEKVYGGEIPSIEKVDFHEFFVSREGPRVLLKFDLLNFPSEPPAKWKMRGMNRVQLSLLGVGVSRLKLTGWGRNLVLNTYVSKTEDGISFSAEGSGVEIEVCADFWVLDKVSGYMEGEM